MRIPATLLIPLLILCMVAVSCNEGDNSGTAEYESDPEIMTTSDGVQAVV